MYYKTPVPIPYETNRVVHTKASNGEVYVGYTVSTPYDPSTKRTRPVRKGIGKMCPDDETMMYPNDTYYKLFPDKHPSEDNDPVLTEYLNAHATAGQKRGSSWSGDSKANLERKANGYPYCYDDPALLGDQHVYQDKMMEYNSTPATQTAKRQRLLKKIFAEIGADCIVETPVSSNWGCRHVHMGKGVYVNSGVTFVDDADIYIGDYCLIAPNVVFCTSGHPILPDMRRNHYVYNLPIHIGENVWIGSGAQIMPGITIGDNSVIGSGSVVTKDIPANVVAYGVPCRVQREIGEKDREFYCKDRKFPED